MSVLLAATDRAPATVRPSDILGAAIAGGDAKIHAALTMALEAGAYPDELRQIIDVYNPPLLTSSDFDGSRERFSTEALEALDEFADAFAANQERLRPACLELLVLSVLSHLDADDRKMLSILDVDAAVAVLRRQIQIVSDPPTPLFDGASGRLRSEEFTEAAWAVLERAAIHAAELGYQRILPPHCFLALLGETEGLTERLVRQQVTPEVSPARVATAVAEGFRLASGKRDPLQLDREDVGEALVTTLRGAQRAAQAWAAERIDTPHVLVAMLDDPPARLVSILQRDPLKLNLTRMRGHLEQALRDASTEAPQEMPFRLPAGLLPSEDLTWQARNQPMPKALHLDRYFDALNRALYRRTNNHVIITGQRGVGTTTLVKDLARRAAADELPFLGRKRFLLVDCRNVAPAESGRLLSSIISQVAGRTDLIVCLDGLGPLLRAESGGNHKLMLKGALQERRIHLVGVMDSHDYEDLLSADHALLELVTRVDVTEPERAAAMDMARQIADSLSAEFGVVLEQRAVERAVVLSADYILNERFPKKAAKVLHQVCEDLDYERTQLGSDRIVVNPDDVIRVISQISGVPAGQLSGTGGQGGDTTEVLGRAVVGQDEAVAAVARELRLIKAGIRSGSVLFFAGLTGVGKTELAKALASVYSASKRLQTYTMGNFTEAHSVSGIIGVPPGYVGHEQGGRLVNDLNADPYCVFLFDEAEKAHPDIWKPFLNLFDEGWVTDQRGVKAFGDRAIFILTSNAGAEVISKLKDRSVSEIVEGVKEVLPKTRNRTGELVFTPEFLARIREIIVFKPLDLAAMEGICRKIPDGRRRFWSEKREKELVVPNDLIVYIARQSHADNDKSNGKEGGRIVAKKISELIEGPIAQEAENRPDAFRACQRIELTFLPPGPSLPGQPTATGVVDVTFRSDGVSSRHDKVQRAVGELREGLDGDTTSLADRLTRLEAALSRHEAPAESDDDLLAALRNARNRIEEHALLADQEARTIVTKLISTLSVDPEVEETKP